MMHSSYSCKVRSWSKRSTTVASCIKAIHQISILSHLLRLSRSNKIMSWFPTSAKMDNIAAQSVSDTAASILSLPPEVVGRIDQHLPLVDKLALRCTSRQFFYYLPAISIKDQRKLTVCEHIRVMSMLAFDRKRRLCALCKHWYPKTMFMDGRRSSKEMDGGGSKSMSRISKLRWRQSGTAGAIDAPSGCCPWHSASLYKLVTQQDHPMIVLPNWSQRSELLCLHCGRWKSEGDCKCQLTTQGDNECGCSVRNIMAYRRYGGSSCQKLLFSRDDHGDLFVREWYRLPSSWAMTEHALQKFEKDLHDKNLYWRDIPVAG